MEHIIVVSVHLKLIYFLSKTCIVCDACDAGCFDNVDSTTYLRYTTSICKIYPGMVSRQIYYTAPLGNRSLCEDIPETTRKYPDTDCC